MDNFQKDLAVLINGKVRSVYRALILLHIKELGDGVTFRDLLPKFEPLNVSLAALPGTLYELETECDLLRSRPLSEGSRLLRYHLSDKAKALIADIDKQTAVKLAVIQKSGMLQITHAMALMELGFDKIKLADSLREPIKEKWGVDLGKSFLTRFNRKPATRPVFIRRNENKEYQTTTIGKALLAELAA